MNNISMENITATATDGVKYTFIPDKNTTHLVELTDSLPQPIQSLALVVALSLLFGVIILLTIAGNVLVCLSPLVSSRLRTVTYNFLVSLAVADLLLGLTVLPFSAISALTAEWYFGVVFCNIYISCDVLFSTASILHLLVISLDRYVAITRPYAYQSQMNHRKAGAAITFVWIISFCVSFIPLHLGWNTPTGQVQNFDKPAQCTFIWNTSYNLFDGILLFFVPLTLMCAVYIRIVVIASRQAKAITKLMVNPHAQHGTSTHFNQIDEHRAIKIIAIVMGCFVICWVPYFTMFTFSIVCGWQISDACYQVALWLGYTNSLVNPLIYGLMNREFRRAFRILSSCSRWDLARCGYGSREHETRNTDIALASRPNCNGSVIYARPTICVTTHTPITQPRR